MAADVILTGGTVLTLDDARTIAQAIAVAGGRIVAVGRSSHVQQFAGSDATMVALRGRTVIPGLVDAHAHMEREGLKQLRLSLAGAKTQRSLLSEDAALPLIFSLVISGQIKLRRIDDWWRIAAVLSQHTTGAA